jgi:cytochrome c oxidase assembly protein subunit 15
MALLALLVWFSLGRFVYAPAPEARMLRGPAAAGLAFLSLQILLGGWVSANYAGLACPDLPGCLGQAVPPMDFGNAFHVVRELGRTDAGELLPQAALTAIHWSHRAFAVVVVAVVAWVAFLTMKMFPRLGIAIALLLLAQFALGIANVAFSLPLALAAAHNAGAALLLGALVVLNFFSFRGLRPSW